MRLHVIGSGNIKVWLKGNARFQDAKQDFRFQNLHGEVHRHNFFRKLMQSAWNHNEIIKNMRGEEGTRESCKL